MDVTVTDSLLQYGRALEWLTSAVIMVFAITLALPGDTLEASPSFSGFINVGLTETAVAVTLTAVAVMRMAGLYINGHWRRSPLLRMVGAIMGAAIFAAMGALFSLPYLLGQQEALSTGAGVYTVLFAFDILAAYRAGSDVGHSKRT